MKDQTFILLILMILAYLIFRLFNFNKKSLMAHALNTDDVKKANVVEITFTSFHLLAAITYYILLSNNIMSFHIGIIFFIVITGQSLMMILKRFYLK